MNEFVRHKLLEKRLNLNAKAFELITKCKINNCEKLDLSELNLHEIPAEVFELKQLKILILNYGLATGKRNIIKEMPDGISELKNLERLEIPTSDLISISKKIGTLKKLKYLNLARNFDLSSFPVEICQLENLKELNICFTKIKKLPKEIVQMENLEKIFLSEFRFETPPENIAKQDISVIMKWFRTNNI